MLLGIVFEHAPLPQQDRTRSPRFAIDSPLRYRQVGDTSWHTGQIANISGSGVLFHADDPLALATRIELSFALQAAAVPSNEHSATVFCLGHIVRVQASQKGDAGLFLAASIRNYRFLRDRGEA